VILLGALAVVGAVVASIALAAPLAAPSITASPPNLSATTTSSFSFSGPKGASLECRLDGASFATCTSPKSYPGLGLGSHAFRVRAKKGSDTSSETTYTWSIVVPTAAITAGPTGTINTQSASFAFTANATDATFECKLDGASFTACTSPKSYSSLVQGGHTFQVRALGSAGTGGPVSQTFSVDSVAPMKPAFSQTPPDPSTTATSTFAWSSLDPTPASGLNRYECSKENGAFITCTSAHTYAVSTTNNGQHQFAVRAIDNAGNVSQVASYKWKVDKGSPQDFTIAGTVTGLVPGTWVAIPVTIGNPNPEPLYVTALSVTVVASAPNGCSSATNFETIPSSASATSKLGPIPAGATNWPVPPSASPLGTPQSRPQIRLKETGSSQDTCKNQTFDLTYSGTGTSDPS
jgi:hypothetical protein